tara:strand:- start:4591 stop:4806 length:216 start_codon:yes stop_codon:yes gene_type:complete
MLIGSGKFVLQNRCPGLGDIDSDLQLQESDDGPIQWGREGLPITDPLIARTSGEVPHDNSSLRYPIERLRK